MYCKEHVSLLQSAASNYDAQFKINTNKSSRKVYFHDTNNDSDSDYDRDFSTDTPVDTVLAYLARIHGETDNSYYLPEDRYNQLSPEAKEIWNMLPKDIKSIILHGSPSDVKRAPYNNQIFKTNKKNPVPVRTKLKNNPDFKLG